MPLIRARTPSTVTRRFSIFPSHFSQFLRHIFTMSLHIDAILERLDRFDERIDATGHSIKQQVDQRVGELKRKVAKIRSRILRASIRDSPLVNPLLSGTTVTFEDYLVNRSDNRNGPDSPDAEPAPGPSAGQKRKHASHRRDKRRQKNRAPSTDSDEGDQHNENPNSGVYKVKVRNLNCPEGCQGLTLKTRKQYHDHLHKEHGLLPFACLRRGCGQRFSNR